VFQELLPSSFIERSHQQAKAKFNNSVYTPLVVMWLLMQQRAKHIRICRRMLASGGA